MPDPAFHFDTPRTTYRRLNGWFRGTRVNRNDVGRALQPAAGEAAREAAERAGATRRPRRRARWRGSSTSVPDAEPTRCGSPGKGVPALALDYSRGAANAVQRQAEEEGLDLEVGWMNLHELRSVLAQGARVARLPGPPTLLANHLIDATDQRGLEALARFARMALSGGGRLYADFDALRPGERSVPPGPRDATRPKDAERVLQTLRGLRSRYRAEHSGADIGPRRR